MQNSQVLADYSVAEIQMNHLFPRFLEIFGTFHLLISKFLLGYSITPMRCILSMFENQYLEGSLR